MHQPGKCVGLDQLADSTLVQGSSRNSLHGLIHWYRTRSSNLYASNGRHSRQGSRAATVSDRWSGESVAEASQFIFINVWRGRTGSLESLWNGERALMVIHDLFVVIRLGGRIGELFLR